MSRRAYCGDETLGRRALCGRHGSSYDDNRATGNRIMCDFGLLSGSARDSRLPRFLAPSTGETALASSRLEPVENDHRADDESDIHDESGNRIHAIGRALRSAGLHARHRFSKNVEASLLPL